MNHPIHDSTLPAIILDAGKLAQVAILQDLGRRGIPIVAIAGDFAAMGFHSRYAGRKLVSPVPSYDDAYAGFLIEHAPRGVLFCSNDACAEMLSRNRMALARAGFSFLASDAEVLRDVVHKERLYAVAQRSGVLVPRSRLTTAQDAARTAREIGFPCILKSTNLAGGVYEPLAQSEDVEGAVRRMSSLLSGEEWRHRNAQVMIQEWIDQQNTALWNFNALAKDGEIVSYSMGRRLRTDIRRDGAIGSMLLYGRTEQNEDVLDANRRVLRQIRYSGILETEWSQNRLHREKLYLYDFNPRPSGNFRWTLQSGVPMALQYYQLSLGIPVSSERSMSPGVAYFKILTRQNDFLWAVKNPQLSLWQKGCVLAQDVAALCRPGRNAVDVLALDDLGPTVAAVRELASTCWGAVGRSVRKRLPGSPACVTRTIP